MINLFTQTDIISELLERFKAQMIPIFRELNNLELDQKIIILNEIKTWLHEISPFKDEPVDCVKWIPADDIQANDYNPNSVAPPEMRLLEHSILNDGYTQPIVAWLNGQIFEVVDGFHRNRIGRESRLVKQRIHGYLPLTIVNEWRTERNDRIAATIRHNRARGKHRVEGMSDIVVELKKRNWTNERIEKELGMDPDEILRLCQVTGLLELFSDQEFSKSWNVEGAVTEEDFQELTDDISTFTDEEVLKIRTVNTSDSNRIFHTYEKWECYKAGFYKSTMDGMTKTQCEQSYKDLLSNETRFAEVLERVITEWKYSCEHYLTNVAMNRIAWLGQAALCYAYGIPSSYRNGFNLLTTEQQERANQVALEYLNRWLMANGREVVTMEEAYSGDRQSDIY